MSYSSDEIRRALEKSAWDSEAEVTALTKEQMLVRIHVDALQDPPGKIVLMEIPHPVHVDLPPFIQLGHFRIGDATLLPEGYMAARFSGYEGDEATFCVTCMRDDEGNSFFIISSKPVFRLVHSSD